MTQCSLYTHRPQSILYYYILKPSIKDDLHSKYFDEYVWANKRRQFKQFKQFNQTVICTSSNHQTILIISSNIQRIQVKGIQIIQWLGSFSLCLLPIERSIYLWKVFFLLMFIVQPTKGSKSIKYTMQSYKAHKNWNIYRIMGIISVFE